MSKLDKLRNKKLFKTRNRKLSKTRNKKLSKIKISKCRKNKISRNKITRRNKYTNRIKLGGMPHFEEIVLDYKTQIYKLIQKGLELPDMEDVLIVDIQGITADQTKEEERIFFTEEAPNKIKAIIDEEGKRNIVIISQCDKANGDKMGYTGIGATIAELYNRLVEDEKNVKIFVIGKKEAE